MKMKSAVIASLLVLVVLAAIFVSGCATTPPVDWGSRVGHYTYAQAVHELGPPNRQIRLSNGQTTFRWFRQTAQTETGISVGGMNEPGMNPGMNNNFGNNSGFDNRYLELTFDRNGVLTAWSKNY